MRGGLPKNLGLEGNVRAPPFGLGSDSATQNTNTPSDEGS